MYADAALDAIGERTELLVVGQSFGGFPRSSSTTGRQLMCSCWSRA
jgi:hypothetical protein